jgi:hypothetical protein
MVYGWCLLRIIHFVVALRLAHPGTRILVSKYDCSDAYRRIAHVASAMIKSIIVTAGIAYLTLRLTFGGSPNPPTWCSISEMLTDLANEVPLCSAWDPGTDPTQGFNTLDNSIPFAEACEMAYVISTTLSSQCDCFVDAVIQSSLTPWRTVDGSLASSHSLHLSSSGPTPVTPNPSRVVPSSLRPNKQRKGPRQSSRSFLVGCWPLALRKEYVVSCEKISFIDYYLVEL